MEKKPKIATFEKMMSLEEAKLEKAKGTPVGEALKRADEEYKKRRNKT